MVSNNSKYGLAMLNMLIFVFLFTMFAGLILTLVSSHTRYMEDHVRGIKAFYIAEAGIVHAMESLRKGVAPVDQFVYWSFNPATGNPTGTKTAILTITTNVPMPWGITTEIQSHVDHTV